MNKNDISNIQDLIDFALKYKLRRIKVGTTELELTDSSFVPSQAAETLNSLVTKDQMPSDTDMLFWSSPGELPADQLMRESEEDKA